MNEQLKKLISLQQIEIEIKGIGSRIQALSRKVDTLDAELSISAVTISEKKAVITEMQAAYRSYESDAQSDAARIRKSETTLRAVKTNREYQAVLKEIEEMKSKTSRLEDVMLEQLEKMDQIESEINAQQDTFNHLEASSETEKGAIGNEIQDAEQELKKLGDARDRVSQTIDSKLKQAYEAIKERVKGIAVAPVEGSVCRGCYMNIPPQMFNELQQRDDLTFCPHCQRMIYPQNEFPQLQNEGEPDIEDKFAGNRPE